MGKRVSGVFSRGKSLCLQFPISLTENFALCKIGVIKLYYRRRESAKQKRGIIKKGFSTNSTPSLVNWLPGSFNLKTNHSPCKKVVAEEQGDCLNCRGPKAVL